MKAEQPHTDPEIAAAAVTAQVLEELAAERVRQRAKWGEQNFIDGTRLPAFDAGLKHARERAAIFERAGRGLSWADVLLEEVFEALVEEDPAKIRAELVQSAAVHVQWIEAIDRRARKGLDRPSPAGTSET